MLATDVCGMAMFPSCNWDNPAFNWTVDMSTAGPKPPVQTPELPSVRIQDFSEPTPFYFLITRRDHPLLKFCTSAICIWTCTMHRGLMLNAMSKLASGRIRVRPSMRALPPATGATTETVTRRGTLSSIFLSTSETRTRLVLSIYVLFWEMKIALFLLVKYKFSFYMQCNAKYKSSSLLLKMDSANHLYLTRDPSVYIFQPNYSSY